MKKGFFILAGILLLLSCNEKGKTVTIAKAGFDTLPRAKALQMMEHYLDSNVNHDLDHIIKWFRVDSSVLALQRSTGITAAKYITAAYLDSEPDSTLRNRPVILMQVKSKDDGGYVYYLLPPPVCPPPPDCYTTPAVEE